MVLLWEVNKSTGLFLWTWAVSPNKSIWAADFPFVLLSSYPTVTHSAWLSRNIHGALSLPISRCNKTQRSLLWGTLKGILWGRWESQAEWQPTPQPHLYFVMAGTRQGGKTVMGGIRGGQWGVVVAMHWTAFLHHGSIATHHEKNGPSEWTAEIT